MTPARIVPGSFMPGGARRTLATALALAILLAHLPGIAHPTLALCARITIRSATSFEQVAVLRLDDGLEVRGSLHDDSGTPIAAAIVQLQAATRVWPCQGPERAQRPATTDQQGAFCFRLPASALGLRGSLRHPGSAFYGSSTRSLEFRPTRERLKLAFLGQPLSFRLDHREHRIQIQTELSPGHAEARAIPLTLTHLDGAERRQLGHTEQPGAGQTAIFRVRSERLGPPGAAKLKVAFAGTDAIASSQRSVAISRLVPVILRLPQPVDPVQPSEGFEFTVEADSAVGPVPNGLVEAVFEGRVVGRAQVHEGSAVVRATFEAPRRQYITLALRYLGHDPWWLPGGDVPVTLAVVPASWWRHLAWALPLVVLAFLFARAWRRPTRRRGAVTTKPPGRPMIEVVERGTVSGWRGRVIDAHDGTPIAGARLRIVRPVFQGDSTAAEAVAADNGSFRMEGDGNDSGEGGRLLVTAPDYRALEQVLPPAGTLSISMVSRRRAILNDLVRWARRLRSAGQDPTPEQIAAIAERRSDAALREWAQAVEEAAYGAAALDEAREQSVRNQEPKTNRAGASTK